MPNPSAKSVQAQSRRTKVAALLLRGVSNQLEIAAKLGMEPGQQPTISKDIKAIKDEWRKCAVRDFDEAVGRELEKLDVLEREFWEAWERSRSEKTSERNRSTKRPGKDGESTETEEEHRKELRDGNPKFLEGVLACIAKRAELLGLDAPKQHQVVTGAVKVLVADGGFDPDAA